MTLMLLLSLYAALYCRAAAAALRRDDDFT